jgi:hypothetical protein
MVNKEQVLGLIRHTLTFVGGCLVANGILTDAVSADIVGSCMALIGAIWSLMVK